MSRNQPHVILEYVDKDTYKCDQIIEASGIWAVYYDDQPINLKSSHYLNGDSAPKYKKTSFSNPGHAFNLAERLNKQFNTDEFCVVRLEGGPVVQEDEVRNESSK